MIKIISWLLIGWCGVVANAASHTFFVGTTDISVNKYTDNTEIIHRFTSHDVEALLSDLHNLRVSADSERYLRLLKEYVEQRFSLIDQNNNVIKIGWIGIEPGINYTYIYQEIPQRTTLSGLTINHQLLTDFFPKQKNRLNYRSLIKRGSLLFDSKVTKLIIK